MQPTQTQTPLPEPTPVAPPKVPLSEPELPVIVEAPLAPVAPESVAKPLPRQRHYLALFFFSFGWGVFGADRFYMGKIGTGILKLITAGGFGIWALTDLIIIMAGAMTDKHDRPALQYAEYKKFAYRTVFVFAVAIGVGVLILGIITILSVTQLINAYMDGGLDGILPGLNQIIPGGGGTGGLDPAELQELGI